MLRILNFRLFALLSLELLSLKSQLLYAQGTFTEMHSISCNDSLLIPKLGYPTWATAQIIKRPKFGFAILSFEQGYQTLHYTSPPYTQDLDTFIVSCAHATQLTCDTGIYIMRIECPNTDDKGTYYYMNCKDSINTQIDFSTVQIFQGPIHGKAGIYQVQSDQFIVTYKPNFDFIGLDFIELFELVGYELLVYRVDCTLNTKTIDEEPQHAILFPNPVKDNIIHFMLNNEQVISADLLNSIGMPLHRKYSKIKDDFIMDINNLSGGWYTLIIRGEKRIQYMRLLIIH